MENSFIEHGLICPSCGMALNYRRGERLVTCVNGHHFDEAKEGYLNLLLSHQKNSKNPGDTKDMLQARRRFLDGDYYGPIASKISEILLASMSAKDKLSLLDIGCGEGYYLRRVNERLSSLPLNDNLQLWGMDISKDAIRMAAKRGSEVHWLVGNNFKLPFKRDSLDCLLSVFSPVLAEECLRVLVPGGLFIQVYPYEDHLLSFKQQIYRGPKQDKDYEKYQEAPKGFSLRESHKVAYNLKLEANAIEDLLQMTPLYWSVDEEKRRELLGKDLGEFQVSMGIVVYEKEACCES